MIWPENTLKETEIGLFQFLLSEGYKRNDQRQESSGTERQVKDQSMMLSVPDITLTSSCNSLEPSRFRTRRASFSGVQDIRLSRPRLSTNTTSQSHPPVLKESRSSPVSIIEMQPQRTSDRRGSVGQRRRSNSVFAKGLVQPALVLLRVRRRSRALSSREIKLLRVSYNRLSRFVKRQDFLKRYLNLSVPQ